MSKSLFSAGTTWPGVFTAEDQRALDYLCSRPDAFFEEEISRDHGVDAGRIETAHGVARRADQRLSEQIERRVVENRQSPVFRRKRGAGPSRADCLPSTRCGRARNRPRGSRRGTVPLYAGERADAGEVPRVGAGLEVLGGDFDGTEAANLREASRCLMKVLRFSVE
jgi:hypothetical protein